MKIEDYFQDYKTNKVSPLTEMIEYLHDEVSDLINCDATRLEGRLQESYESYLFNKKIPENSRTPKEVLSDLSRNFGGAIRWHNPGSMINVNPPANLPAIAASAYSMLFNPNFAQDLSTGSLLSTELEVIKLMAELVGWDWKNAHGIFTFGGKSTNLHAVKIGLQKALKNTLDKPIKKDVFIISTEQGHPCHTEVCGWLGIGYESLIKVPVDSFGMMDIEVTEKLICENIENGKVFAGMLLNGGTTIQLTVDPINEAVDMRDRLVQKYNLDYSPHIHVDAVIGWAWLFFKDYDFCKNELNFSEKTLIKIASLTNRITQMDRVDSFGADFHKTGYCPYVSSLFMVKDRKYLYELGKRDSVELEELEYGNYSPFEYSLELSRSGTGPISAYMALHCFGKNGFRELIGNLVEVGEYLKATLKLNKEFEVVNDETEGSVTLFVIKNEEFNINYQDIKNMSKEEVEDFAKYNYYFYLYLLEKQTKHEVKVVMDYSSGFDKTPNNTKIGVFKAYHMSPYITKELMDIYINEIYQAKKEFDKIKDEYQPYLVAHKPRQFVLR